MRACQKFFEFWNSQFSALTYADVLLRTGYSCVLPQNVKLASRFSRRVPVKIPVASAAMDTVTEDRMAIAMAKLGGLGVIHRNLSPREQLEAVRRVKFHLSGVIAKPITVRNDETIAAIEERRGQQQFSFHSFPVVDSEDRLVGLLTRNDFDFCTDRRHRASEIMSTELVTAESDTTIDEAHRIMREAKKKVLPLVDDARRLVGMYLFSDVDRIVSGTSDHYNVDAKGRLRVAAAIGTGDDALDRAELLNEYVDVLVIETAHADSENVFTTLRALKSRYDIDVVAGNISEGPSARRLVDAGADGIKVGQGPGAICTTRIVTGIGCPQVTAIYNVTNAIEGSDVPICADGGIQHSGNIPIAIGAGAHTVMLGRLLAGTDEAPGEVDHNMPVPMKSYRGMGSLAAMQSNKGSRERYQQEDTGKDRLVPEGVEGAVPYVGSVGNMMHQYMGGLRRGMGYVGAATIEELRQKADFLRLTPAGVTESHPHNIQIVREAPNYRR